MPGVTNLDKAGYIAVKKVEYDDGVYKVDAVNRQRQYVKVKVSAQTGKVISIKGTSSAKSISMLEAAQHVVAAGYQHIYRMTIDDDGYKVKATNKNDKKVKLKVNATTGKVSKDSWF